MAFLLIEAAITAVASQMGGRLSPGTLVAGHRVRHDSAIPRRANRRPALPATPHQALKVSADEKNAPAAHDGWFVARRYALGSGSQSGRDRPGCALSPPARGSQALGLLVRHGRQPSPRGDHGRSGGHETRRHRWPAVHGSGRRHPERTDEVHESALAGAIQTRQPRSGPTRTPDHHAGQSRLDRQRRAVGQGGTVDAETRVQRDERRWPAAVPCRAAAAGKNSWILSRRRRAGVPHAGERLSHCGYSREGALSSRSFFFARAE